MSRINQLENHPFILSTLPTSIETLSLVENNEELLHKLDEYGTQTLNRINGLLNQLKSRISAIDPYLNRQPTLDSLNEDVRHINAYLQNAPAHLVNTSSLNTINNHIDNIIANMIFIPTIQDLESLEGIKDNVISFRRSVARHKVVLAEQQQVLLQKNEEITKEIEDLNTSFEQLTEKFTNTSNAFDEKFSVLHDTFLETEKIRSEQFAQQLKDIQKTFDDQLSESKEQWEQLLEQNDQVIQETITKLKEEQQLFLDNTNEKQREYDTILAEHKKSVESLVGIISTNSISGHFKEVADKKEKLTTIWQWLTGSGFAITIGFGVYAFIFSKDLDWPSLIARFIVTTALGSFTAYAARQVTKNETQEKYNRQMEVELKTLNPYIAAFSEDDQIKLKEQLFPLIFGRAEINSQQPDKSGSSPSSQLNPQDLTNAIEIIRSFTSGPPKQ
ncbi:hypothetical protein M3204_23415 [Mesobacillus subterraneus]|uniref:hypothetical protein n=1 Tax=Mesobacillus subterraneus TaxID=285983 RepID=UPI00203B841B|nr:hypothetical protein [Mesobacillus subterraneus]MCM3667327.1 hypothetical protein [Mesobacillus subterraneus]MCM3686340.1 hypothetical protein [Mesobacillus subterraneus]